jgi:hypothetical protein
VRQIVMVLELETLGVIDDSDSAPEPAPLAAISTPPPQD